MSSQLAILGGVPSVREDAHGIWPDVQDSDRRAVMGVLDRRILTGGGSIEAPGFECDYAQYTGARHCLAFNAGTAALHACAVGVGLRPGDEVIVPAFTYVASAMFIGLHGARPVFVDIEPNTYLIDTSEIEAKITPRTRAIVAVHLHGLACDMDALLAVARRHRLALIEDISQAHGATYNGQIVGTFGQCAGGSLNATKNLPGGEGGMLLTDDDDITVSARRLRYMGEDPMAVDPPLGRRYWSFGLGYNYRAQELPFAFARSQLQRLDAYNERARRNAEILSSGIEATRGLVVPAVPRGRDHVWYIYRLRLDPDAIGYSGSATELRDRVVAALVAEGVHATLWQHHPLPALPVFRRAQLAPWTAAVEDEALDPWDPADFPIATRTCQETLVVGSGATPLAAQQEELVDSYVAAINEVFARIDSVLEMPFTRPAQSVQADLYDMTHGREGAPASLPVEPFGERLGDAASVGRTHPDMARG